MLRSRRDGTPGSGDEVIRALAVALVVTLAFGGCTAVPAPQTSTPSSPAGPDVDPSPTTATILDPDYPRSETLIASLASQHGIQEVGPFPVASERISIYVRCLGDGEVAVDVVDIGSFSVRCTDDDQDPGTGNTFDSRFAGSIRIRVSGDDSLLWALAVTGGEAT